MCEQSSSLGTAAWILAEEVDAVFFKLNLGSVAAGKGEKIVRSDEDSMIEIFSNGESDGRTHTNKT